MVMPLTCLGMEVVCCQRWIKWNNIQSMASNQRIKKSRKHVCWKPPFCYINFYLHYLHQYFVCQSTLSSPPLLFLQELATQILMDDHEFFCFSPSIHDIYAFQAILKINEMIALPLILLSAHSNSLSQFPTPLLRSHNCRIDFHKLFE